MVEKPSDFNQSQALAFVRNFFQNYHQWFKQEQDPTLTDFEKFFTHDFQLFSNGLLISKNLAEYAARFAYLRKKFARIDVAGLFDEPIASGNRVACHFSFRLTTHAGQVIPYDMMLIVVLENYSRIKRWEQVIHEKGKDWLAR